MQALAIVLCPDMYTLSPWVYIPGRALVPVLQLLAKYIAYIGMDAYQVAI